MRSELGCVMRFFTIVFLLVFFSISCAEDTQIFPHVDVVNLAELPSAPEGYRYLDFIGGSKEIRCYLVPEDMPRNRFMNEFRDQLDVCLSPIYENRGIYVTQDPSFALPGFYIIAHRKQFRSLDEMDEVTHLRMLLILYEIRKGMREALNIQHVHVYYEEKANKSCNVHYWMLPIREIQKFPRIYDFNVKEYLSQFSFLRNKSEILLCNAKLQQYLKRVHLLEKDEDLQCSY